MIFLTAWLGLKLYVDNEIWKKAVTTEENSDEAKKYPFHIGRGRFLIYLMGNIASVLFVFLFLFLSLLINR